ncbi:class I SAM-dependent DNA methyltransferase [Streptomyces sp. NRRL F-5123]|uniref:class I SAM-dependent DNA methyltransferase n=1 Tax=Streptomyces sp. NRRL F-5123 TaxID=1463856 RepID=UPI0004E0EEE3|nr:class I SAM-dependent methyltransferase [Streptomyces sp. NRRL F-5123]
MTSEPSWLEDTRASYDTVAESYTEYVRDLLDDLPQERAAFGQFADLVRANGDGPVADVGCGPGHVTAYLRHLGLDAFGIDLSPRLIEIARRDNPGVRFEVGTMTDLPFPDASAAGLLAYYSLIHIPDDVIPQVLAHFHRVLRPGAPLLLGFHVGDESRLKTEGYGGHPMRVHVHRRPHTRLAAWLTAAGFTVASHETPTSAEGSAGGILLAHRASA